MGFDATWEHGCDRSDAAGADRIRLTRRRAALTHPSGERLMLIESDHVTAQLRQVIQTLGVRRKDIRPFSRCIECNRPLVSVDKDRVRTQVPDYVWHTTDTFRQCPRCAKLFWPGSHTRRTMAVVRQLFDENSPV